MAYPHKPIPTYLQLMGELVGTLETLKMQPLHPMIKEMVEKRCAELMAIGIDDIDENVIYNELVLAKKLEAAYNQSK